MTSTEDKLGGKRVELAADEVEPRAQIKGSRWEFDDATAAEISEGAVLSMHLVMRAVERRSEHDGKRRWIMEALELG